MSLRTCRDFRGPVQDAKDVTRNLFGERERESDTERERERERERARWGSACFYIRIYDNYLDPKSM